MVDKINIRSPRIEFEGGDYDEETGFCGEETASQGSDSSYTAVAKAPIQPAKESAGGKSIWRSIGEFAAAIIGGPAACGGEPSSEKPEEEEKLNTVENITKLDNGALVSPDEPGKIDVDSHGIYISSNTVIVKFKDSATTDEINDALSSVDGVISGYVPNIDYYEVKVATDSAAGVERILDELKDVPGVQEVGKNFLLVPTWDNDGQTPLFTGGPEVEDSLWGYRSIKLKEAYEHIRGMRRLEPRVAVIDTSFALNHPELREAFLRENGRLVGYDFADADDDPGNADMGCNLTRDGANTCGDSSNWEHGTAVTGILAAGNNGFGFNGVSFESKIIPLKAWPSEPNIIANFTKAHNVAQAIGYAVDHQANVINMSFILPGYIPIASDIFVDILGAGWGELRSAVDIAYNRGVVLVAGAGNEGVDASSAIPAANPRVISVGATQHLEGRPEERWSSSNYSSNDMQSVLSLAAPGWDVLTTEPCPIDDNDCFDDDDNYLLGTTVKDGTSGAAPFVSGLAALIKSLEVYSQVGNLTPDNVEEIMRVTADEICVNYPTDPDPNSCLMDNQPDPWPHTWKRINAYNAVVYTLTGCNPRPEVCADNLDNDCDGSRDGADEDCWTCTPEETREFYTGQPASTEDEGECKSGIEICRGGSWEVVEPDVIPQPEVCDDALDNDCDGETDEDCGDGRLWRQVEAGMRHTCGLRSSGRVECWGDDDFGESSPPAATFDQIDVGRQHTCGIETGGTVACWGLNTESDLNPPAGTFTQISVGGYHTCGLRPNGNVECWGEYEQFFTPIPSGIFTQISASGSEHPLTCGLRTDGTVECWGEGEWAWGEASPPPGQFSQVSVGYNHVCGVRTNGTVECWPDSVLFRPPSGTFTQVSAGWMHTCGLRRGGAIECWGSDSHGETIPPVGNFTQVNAGALYSCGVRTDGTIECWGNNSEGQSTPPRP